MKLKIFKNKKALSAILIIFVVFAVGLLFFILFQPVQKTEAALPGVCGDNARGCREDPYDECDNSASACNGNYVWGLTSGDAFSPYCWSGKCCGDDSGEFYKTRVCYSGACTSNSSDKACCNLNEECVYNNSCYSNGDVGDVDSDQGNEYCNNGVWYNCACSSGECCDGCRYKPLGTICRGTGGNECDIAETCTGGSGLCPVDSINSGADCDSGSGYCSSLEKRCIKIKEIEAKNDEFLIDELIVASEPNQAIGAPKGSVVISSTVQLDSGNGAYLIFGQGKNVTFSGNGKVILPANQQGGIIQEGKTTTITQRVAKICVQDNDNDGYWVGYGELAKSDGQCPESRPKDAATFTWEKPALAGDCDDTSAVRYKSYSNLYKDNDNDGYGREPSNETCPIMSGTNCSSGLSDGSICLSTTSNDCNDGASYIYPGWSGWETQTCVLSTSSAQCQGPISGEDYFAGRKGTCQPLCIWCDAHRSCNWGCGPYPFCAIEETSCVGLDTEGHVHCWCCPGGCTCGSDPEHVDQCYGPKRWICPPLSLNDFHIALAAPGSCGSCLGDPYECTVYGKQCRRVSCDSEGNLQRGPLWSFCVDSDTDCEDAPFVDY